MDFCESSSIFRFSSVRGNDFSSQNGLGDLGGDEKNDSAGLFLGRGPVLESDHGRFILGRSDLVLVTVEERGTEFEEVVS